MLLFAIQGLRFSPAMDCVKRIHSDCSQSADIANAGPGSGDDNVTAVYIGGADDMLEAEICAGNYQLVYCSPESLLTDNRWRDMLQNPIYCERFVGLVVDEAHCVKSW